MAESTGRRESVWQLQDAKARFSEVVRRAAEEGPQHVSVRGEPAAVVMSEEDYRQLTSKRPSIVDHILSGETWSDELVEAINDRSSRSDRDIEF
ncbi:MAG TPA: type II toxin-antitoxin system Phd/YefM family antitoxin [Caulobacteraceae bacterium]|jgi:prevent-host-death family protein